MNRTQSIVLIVCWWAVQTASAQVQLVDKSIVTNEGLYFWYPNGEKAFHYAASISPRGDCYTIADGYIFFGWYKGGMNKRDLMISRTKIGSGRWATVQLPHKNTLIGPKKRWGESHNTISVGVSTKDDTIHIFYDHHNDPLKYIVSRKGTAFVADNKFKANIFESTRGYLAKGENLRITYPKVTENGLGDIIVNYRKGSAIGGNEMVHVYDGNKWTRAKQVLRGADASMSDDQRNYAYGAPPVFAGGNLYYAFSVRWKRKKAAGVLNEGVYLAKCGPTMTGAWEDMRGRMHKLPIVDYSPFLIANPKSKGGKGSSGGPGLAVSDNGDIAISYRGRGRGGEFDYMYFRLAGASRFRETRGPINIGKFWGERMYSIKSPGAGRLSVQSIHPQEGRWRTELEIETGIRFGSSVTKLMEGYLVFIAEDRGNRKTDKQNILCYAFKIGSEPRAAEPRGIKSNDQTRTLTNREGKSVEAKLINVQRGKVTCIINGKRYEIPLSVLSDDDAEFLRTWSP